MILGIQKEYVNRTQKELIPKEMIDKLYYTENYFYLSKDMIKTVKRQTRYFNI